MEKQYTFRTLQPGDDFSDTLRVRVPVFIDEQGFDPSSEGDELDPVVHHLVLYDGDKPVATGRVFPLEGEQGGWVIGRICVL